MRTVNQHPKWYDQPLRLNKAERKKPQHAIIDFFDCYYLDEVRLIVWDWLVEVLSSDRSISQEGKERSDHLFFYEKLEKLIEASFVLYKQQPKVKKAGKTKKVKS